MLRPLSTADLRDLNTVNAQLQSGDPAGALVRLETLPPHSREHPNGMFLRAFILQALDRRPEARQVLESALELAPTHAAIWNSYGNLLDDLGEGEAAIKALQKAVELAPEKNDFLINLGIAALSAGQFEVAEEALGKAIRTAPAVARGWSALGLLEQRRGKPDTAMDVYRRALELDPEDVRSRHNLATLLREADRAPEALEETEAAVRAGPVPPETATLRAHLLADVGRVDEAADEYRNIVTQIPGKIEAHEALASLLPQIGRGSEALNAYRAALRARPDSLILWNSALRAGFELKDYVQLAAWGQEAEALIGPWPEVRIARAAALSRLGNHQTAIAILREVIATMPDMIDAHKHLAHCLVAAGEPKDAEAHALRATEIDPLDQAPWALLSVIWRLLDDPREQWLADYERLVMPIDLDAASGFFDELAVHLGEMHIMREHPAEHSLRGGTQTRGHLFNRKDPLIERLIAQIRAGVLTRLRQLPDDAAHPFLSRKARDIRFPASWSVRLRSEGFHIGHIHSAGWISSALYVSLPSEVGQGEAGALAFGVPDAALGLDLPPRRIEQPKAGRLVIFPSYMWHGTLPFESEKPRLTVAFDALPVD